MRYYTQIIFLRSEQEALFQAFEDRVLPFIDRHHGELVLRLRPSESAVLATTVGNPYEIHLVRFPDRAAFESYRDDPERLQYLSLKEQSVERVLLIEGKLL
ncbi:DUF1330 domain-containing protein [Spirosoma koreense]